MYRNKSCPLELLMPRLAQMVDLDLIDLHCLQVGQDAEQLDPWRGKPRIRDWSSELKDFSDTAHVLAQLDLVISVDTAVAHLAAAFEPTHLGIAALQCRFPLDAGPPRQPWYPLHALVPPAASSRLARFGSGAASGIRRAGPDEGG